MEKPLKENELKLVDVVISLFKSLYNGNDKACKTDRILFELSKLSLPVNGNTLRSVIGHIRRNDLMSPGFILSDVNAGYWFSDDDAEMRDFYHKQMNRMTNQFQNLKHLHQRTIMNKNNSQEVQIQLFG